MRTSHCILLILSVPQIVKDLSVILKYTGCVGVLIAFVYPVFLQWKSREMCEKLAIKVESEEAVSANQEEEDMDVQRKLTAPTYSGKLVNHPLVIWIVLAFSTIGLIAVIVLSIAGLSN